MEACERSLIAQHFFQFFQSRRSHFFTSNPELDKAAEAVLINPKGRQARFPRKGSSLIENSANQVDGNSLSVALSKRFSAPRASDK